MRTIHNQNQHKITQQKKVFLIILYKRFEIAAEKVRIVVGGFFFLSRPTRMDMFFVWLMKVSVDLLFERVKKGNIMNGIKRALVGCCRNDQII